MKIDGDYIIKELENRGIKPNSNTEPLILLGSGKNSMHQKTAEKLKNHQVFISIHEVERNNRMGTVERIERRIQQDLPNSKVLPYPIEGIDCAKSIIDALSAHYHVPLIKEEIIRKMDKTGTDYFYLFLVITESTFYS